MPVLPPNPAISSTAGDIIKDALTEIAVLEAGEEIGADDATFCLRKLNRLLDSFNARDAVVFNVNFSTFNLKANHQPHTIGPGGDFDVPIRPVRIEAANLILNNAVPSVNTPIAIRDDQWWANNRVQGLTSIYPTDLYYSPDFPLGNCYFWPVPQAIWPVQLELWSNFAAVTDLTQAIAYPQGYWDAIVYTLAVTLCPAFQRSIDPVLAAAQQKAMASVISNNSKASRIDLGGPSTGRAKGHWDWRTGGIRV